MNHAELRLAFDKKVRSGIFNPIARLLPDEVREDRLQDAICQTWAMYERYAERGELLDDAILVHSCHLRATDPSRHYVPADGQRKKDVYDPRNYLNGNVEVLRLADFPDQEDGCSPPEGDAPTGFGLAETNTPDPTRKIVSAIDLTRWLARLSAEERRMLELRGAGYTLAETATRLGMSVSGVFTACKRLGFELGSRADVEVPTVTAAIIPIPRRAKPVIASRQRTRRTAACAA